MKKFTLLFSTLLVTVLFIFVPDILASDPPLPLMGNDPSQAPIDGGLALLAAAGGGYAIKKLRDKKK